MHSVCNNGRMLRGTSDIDGLSEFALHFLLSGQGDARLLVADMVQRMPALPVLELIFVLASAASGLESVFSSAEAKAIALDVWRMASMVGVDLHMMRELGLPRELCADLLEYWRTEDGFFLA